MKPGKSYSGCTAGGKDEPIYFVVDMQTQQTLIILHGVIDLTTRPIICEYGEYLCLEAMTVRTLLR